jgi:hypothetical protein
LETVLEFVVVEAAWLLELEELSDGTEDELVWDVEDDLVGDE